MSVEPLTVETQTRPDGTWLRLAGELDLSTVPTLERALEPVWKRGDRAVLDLRDLDFIDSSGLRAILRAHQHAEGRDWTLEIIRGPGRVHRIFEITSTEGALPFRDDPHRKGG